jgi:hypothetical protein
MAGFILLLSINNYSIRTPNELDQLLSRMIDFSGIFSAILITFLISKVFQIRQEKIQIARNVEDLSNKVTDFRRIAFWLIDAYSFWEASMRDYMDTNYKSIDSSTLNECRNNPNHPSYELVQKLYSEFGQTGTENPELSSCFYGFDLYFNMKALVADSDYLGSPMYDEQDWNEIYTLKQIEKWADCGCGNYWPFFSDEKWGKFNTTFHFNLIKPEKNKKILRIAKKLDQESQILDNKLLERIGNRFSTFHIPMLMRYLMELEQPIPYLLKALLRVLFFTLISGLFFPIVLSAISDNNIFEEKLSITLVCLTFLLGTIIYFLFNLKSLLNEVIDSRRFTKSINEHI